MSDQLALFEANMKMIDLEYNFEMSEEFDKSENDDMYEAKEFQTLFLNNLSKNVLFVMFSYLKSH